MRTENEYYLVVPEGKLENPLTQVFCQWIAGQVGNTDYCRWFIPNRNELLRK